MEKDANKNADRQQPGSDIAKGAKAGERRQSGDRQDLFESRTDLLPRSPKATVLLIDTHVDTCLYICVDMYLDMRVGIYMCIGMYVDLYVNMCLDMYVDMCIDMCVDMCTDMCLDACRHI